MRATANSYPLPATDRRGAQARRAERVFRGGDTNGGSTVTRRMQPVARRAIPVFRPLRARSGLHPGRPQSAVRVRRRRGHHCGLRRCWCWRRRTRAKLPLCGGYGRIDCDPRQTDARRIVSMRRRKMEPPSFPLALGDNRQRKARRQGRTHGTLQAMPSRREMRGAPPAAYAPTRAIAGPGIVRTRCTGFFLKWLATGTTYAPASHSRCVRESRVAHRRARP
jgi:hypothetical protein